jgi:outer membrane protein insertion porin family
VLLVGTIIGGWSAPLLAQDAPPAPQPDAAAPQPATQQPPAAAPQTATLAAPEAAGSIRSIAVKGNQRLEPATVISYANLTPGQTYTAETLDQALKDLYATELFTDVVITGADTGNIVITVQENPVINRIVLEGNKRLKDDKITPEIQLKPREIFTRSKVRADVDRIIDLYKRQGRFAARVDPKMVQLDQNRVDLIFEIYEGPVSKVRKINVIGNTTFGDDRLRKEMYTRQAGGILGFLKSNDTYDPDRLAADQQKLRAFYLTEGYADFRVVSALAELTPDRRDFIITYVVEEGPRYKFGPVTAESALRDLPKEKVMQQVTVHQGEWFNAKAVEDIVTNLNETAGNLGYAFADINPAYTRNADAKTMDVVFRVGETPRVYVERIDINGNTVTHDKVIRREFRVNEGDAFNAIKIKRSQDRIQSLGYFQDNVEIKQTEGSAPDRVALGVDVEEKATGQLQFSAGYSSLEKFLVSLAVQQSNFRGMGQSLDAGVSWSRYSKSISAGFTEPYLFDKQILLGGQIFRRDYNSFNFINSGGSTQRNTTYSQQSTGGALRLGFPLTEFLTYGIRYSLVQDKVSLSKSLYYTDPDGSGPQPLQCNPLLAGRYLCDEIGNRLTSSLGHSIAYDDTDGIRPTRGQRFVFNQDFAGLGGSVKYIRTRADATKYHSFGGGWILSGHLEGGYIYPLQKSPGPGRDPIRLTDRFFGQDMRGFDIRGIGPRIIRIPYDDQGILTNVDLNDPKVTSGNKLISDALGGHAYYMGRLELEVPTSSSIRSLGLRPSAFVDVGSVWGLETPSLIDIPGTCTPSDITQSQIVLNPGQTKADCPATGYVFAPGYKEVFLGNSPKPRISIGVGVNWISPFGPLRLDIAKALVHQKGDDTKLFSFNVGTQF